jgi:hypothetical protein
MTYVSVANHRRMALDRVRNDAYADALRSVVTPSSVVLDLGAGTGVHGLIAARLGARRVYLVEPEDVISVAEEIVHANGLDDVVTCVHGRIEQVDIPEPVDIIVSALTGNFLLSEDLLPVLFHARDAWLAPGGSLVPDRALMEVAPVSAPGLHACEVAGWSDAQHDITLTPARNYAANTVHYRWNGEAVTYLAAPQTVHQVNLQTDQYVRLHAAVEFQVDVQGPCHGFAGWFSMRLGQIWASTGPRAQAMHWSPAFMPLDPPVTFNPGDVISFELDRPPYGEWSWRTSWPGGSQRHSTLLAAPIKASTLKKASLEYDPVLNEEGHATTFVLSRCTGQASVCDIARGVQERWPARYRTHDEALHFVQMLVKRFA